MILVYVRFTHLFLLGSAELLKLPPRLAQVARAIGCDIRPEPQLQDTVAFDAVENVTEGKVSSLGQTSYLTNLLASEGPTSGDEDVSNAFACVFDQWYPPVGSEDFIQVVQLDDGHAEDFRPEAAAAAVSDITSFKLDRTTAEVLPNGTALLLEAASALGAVLDANGVFVDVGSGIGRLALQVHLTSEIGRVIGIDTSVGRDRLARAAGQAALGLETMVYGLGVDNHIYAQQHVHMNPTTRWTEVNKGPLESIAAHGNYMYGVRSNNCVYRVKLSSMNSESEWRQVSQGDVIGVAFHSEYIYAAGVDQLVWRQQLNNMTIKSNWTLIGRGHVMSIAIVGDTIYCVGVDGSVWKQPVNTMTADSQWLPASKGAVERISIHGDNVYGVAADSRVWTQRLSTMTPTTEWQLAAAGSVIDITVSDRGVLKPGGADKRDLVSNGPRSPIEFVGADLLQEVERLAGATVVHLSSLRFSRGLTSALAWELAARLRPGTVVFSQRSLPGCHSNLKRVRTLRVPTSWNNAGSRYVVYVVVPSPYDDERRPTKPTAPRPVEWLSAFAANDAHQVKSDDATLDENASSISTGGVADLNMSSNSTGNNTEMRRAKDGNAEGAGVCAWRALTSRVVYQNGLQGNISNATDLLDKRLNQSEVVSRLNFSIGNSASYRMLGWFAATSRDGLTAASALRPLMNAPNFARSINTFDNNGLQPLGLAIRKGHTEVARALLLARATTDVQDSSGHYPLHLSALHGHTNVTGLLIDHGCQKDKKNEDDQLAWQLAPLDNNGLLKLLGRSVQEKSSK